MFRMLKLKPPHGWNAVAWELAIVVFGVLIALGAQQIAEDLDWRQKVAIVRQSIMRELANDRARWEQIMKESPCILRDADALERWATEGAPMDRKPAADALINSNLLWMHWANWDLAKSSQTLDHFPLDEQLAFATMYDGIAHRQIGIEQETDLVTQAISLIPAASDPQDRRELRIALANLRTTSAGLTGNDGYMIRHFDALGVRPDPSDFAADLTDAAKCGD